MVYDKTVSIPVLVCPSRARMTSVNHGTIAQACGKDGLSYIASNWLTARYSTNGVKASMVTEPSNRLWVIDGGENQSGDPPLTVSSNSGQYMKIAYRHPATSKGMSLTEDDVATVTTGGTNAVMMDGHVDARSTVVPKYVSGDSRLAVLWSIDVYNILSK